MKYNGFYYNLFSHFMKKTIEEKYDKKYANEIMKKSKKLYRELVEKADDIGDDNPMAFNELFALAFVSPYLASDKKIPPETIREMMKRSLEGVQLYFRHVNFNTARGKEKNLNNIKKYIKWYTPEREKKYPTAFKIDFEGKPHEDACYFRITRCPICIYCKKIDAIELMPLFCELDHLMVKFERGILHREKTIANGDEYCDYYITGDKEKIDG